MGITVSGVENQDWVAEANPDTNKIDPLTPETWHKIKIKSNQLTVSGTTTDYVIIQLKTMWSP